jgi:hypothetical protein
MPTSTTQSRVVTQASAWRTSSVVLLALAFALGGSLLSRDHVTEAAMGGGGGVSPINPPQLPTSLLPTTPTLHTARRDTLIEVTIVSTRRSLLVLRSADNRTVVTVPVEAGVQTIEFTVPAGSTLLLSLLDSEVIDLPVSAGQTIRAVLY